MPSSDTNVNSYARRLWRLIARPLPVQFARRRRKLRSGGGGAFLGVVTECVRASSGSMEITGRRLTSKPYTFEGGAEFTAWAGINPIIVVDSMVLVVAVAPLTEDTGVRYYAVPHWAVHPAYLDEPDEGCLSGFGAACDPLWPEDPCVDSP